MARIAFTYEPKDSFLSRTVPAFKLLYLLLFSILISSAGVYEIYIYAFFIITIGAFSKINLMRLLLSMHAMIAISFFIAITEWSNTKNISSTLSEAVSYLTLLLLTLLFMATTDITDLSASLGHYLEPIIGKSSWRLASNIMVTLAMLPMIFFCANTMLMARRSRGGRFFSHPFKNITSYTISLFLLLFEKVQVFEDALLSRSFSNTAPRRTDKASFCDILALVCVVLITIAIFIIRSAS